MNRRTILPLGLLALALLSPARILAWKLEDASLVPVPLPAGIQTTPAVMSADFDNDGQLETLSLTDDGRAAIQTGELIRWHSPQNWQVRQALIADLNRDGRPEAVLLVWRPFQPWPVDAWLPHGGRIEGFQDASGRSCQIILIGWYRGAFRERWAGSALAEPVAGFATADLTGNGEQFLVTLDARYDDPPSAPARQLKVWEWNGFGFSLVSTLEGPFNHMAVVQADDGQIYILVP